MKKLLSFVFLSGFVFSGFSQENENRSSSLNQVQDLENVVLTGQYSPQSVNQSVFEVEVLSRQDIERMAGNTLEDVLKQNLNLNVVPNAGQGRSELEQFGFNSEYIKILVDGIPVVGDQGFGNAIDIAQINLDDIKQIEIVEGAMGVQYGANAVTGVINIITEKGSKYDWSITPYIQEETIGKEYNLSDQGRHIQSIKGSHNFSDQWYAEASFTRNDFRGLWGQKKGKHYFNPTNGHDGKRGYAWLPKEQNNLKGLLHYTGDNFQAFYKFEYFHEKTNRYAHDVQLNKNSATGTVRPTAHDEIFRTRRLYNHLNLRGKLLRRMNYNISLSYQKQNRNQEAFTYHLQSGEKSNKSRYDYNTQEGIFSRGTLSHLLPTDRYNLELGYEINRDKGIASGLSEQNSSTDTETNQLNTYSGFVSAELHPSDRLALRPGFRYISTNKFADQYAFSFSGKYDFKNNYQLRAVVGSSPKTPNFEQLYFYLVDSNHNIQGNEALNPEQGKSAFLHFKKKISFKNSTIVYRPKLSTWYLDVKDKIDLIITDTSPLTYTYHNIDKYTTWGVAFRNKLSYGPLHLGLGFSLNGQSKELKGEENYKDDFLYSFQLNANLAYQVPKWNTVFSTYFKYNGKQYQYVSDVDDQGKTQFHKDQQDGYGWLDASVKKSFFANQFEITLGVRNLLDITAIQSTSDTGAGDVHNNGSNTLLMGYGRSYFLKLLYNLNF